MVIKHKNYDVDEEGFLIIRFVREHYQKTGKAATVTETCKANEIEIEEVGELFPDGYHRGAVKLAGLRERVQRIGPNQNWNHAGIRHVIRRSRGRILAKNDRNGEERP